MVGVALLLFPKLALGLSGFETGVAVMPLVKGDPADTPERPEGRIRNTRKLLLVAALIMSVFLLASSLVTTLLIPAEEFRGDGGQPAARPTAAPWPTSPTSYFGEAFGTVYDLIDDPDPLVRRGLGDGRPAQHRPALPAALRHGAGLDARHAAAGADLHGDRLRRHGDLPGRRRRPGRGLRHRRAGADDLGRRRRDALGLRGGRHGRRRLAFAAIALVFVYTTVVNVIERPDGVKIAAFFIGAIVVVSLVSRALAHAGAAGGADRAGRGGPAVHRRGGRGARSTSSPTTPTSATSPSTSVKEREQREDFHIPPDEPRPLPGGHVRDASEFSDVLRVRGEEVGGHRVLRAEADGGPQRDRRLPAPPARHDGQAAARLLQLDRGQPAAVPGPLRPVGPRATSRR